MRHLELMTCIVAGFFTRPEHYVDLNRRLEHALDDKGAAKRRAGRPGAGPGGKPRPN